MPPKLQSEVWRPVRPLVKGATPHNSGSVDSEVGFQRGLELESQVFCAFRPTRVCTGPLFVLDKIPTCYRGPDVLISATPEMPSTTLLIRSHQLRPQENALAQTLASTLSEFPLESCLIVCSEEIGGTGQLCLLRPRGFATSLDQRNALPLD